MTALYSISSLQRLQMAQWAVSGVEAEVEDAESALLSSSDKGVKVRLPANVQGHVTSGPAHLKLHIVTSDLWCFWQIETDIAEGES